MSDPDDLGPMMHQAIDLVRPDMTKLLAGGIEIGRARQRRARLRRNLVTVAAPLGVAAAVVILAAAHGGGSNATGSAGESSLATGSTSATTPDRSLPPNPSRAQSSTVVTTSDGTTTTTAAASPLPVAIAAPADSSVASTRAAQSALVPLTSAATAQLMVDLLPADGVASHYTGSPNDEPGEYVGGAANYVRHGVRADVEVLFSVHARGPFDCTGFDNFVCSVRHLSDGSTLVTASTTGTAFVQVVRPNGTLIMASEDVTHDAQGAMIRPEKVNPPMPLTTAELEAVARSDQWQKMVTPSLSRRAADKYTVIPTRTATAPPTTSR